MKSVMISIRPKWVEKIASGKKTIEIRKTRPKLKTPFKCYIYCTKKKHLLAIFRKGDYIFSDDHKAGKFNETIFVKGDYYWSGKVIGEFICDRIDEWKYLPDGFAEIEGEKMYYITYADGLAACLTYDEIEKYGKGKTLYGWHISDLKIYDKPKELSEFVKVCPYAYFQHNEREGDWFCNAVEFGNCKYKDVPKCSGENNEYEDYAYCMCGGEKPIRPFQSLCYVEAVEE